MVLVTPVEIERRLTAALPAVAEKLRLSQEDVRILRTELAGYLSPPPGDSRRYEDILASVKVSWRVWQQYRSDHPADFYLAALCDEIWALSATAAGQPQWRRYLAAALRSVPRRKQPLTDLEVTALDTALARLTAPTVMETDLEAAVIALEQAGWPIGPALSDAALREFVDLCADEFCPRRCHMKAFLETTVPIERVLASPTRQNEWMEQLAEKPLVTSSYVWMGFRRTVLQATAYVSHVITTFEREGRPTITLNSSHLHSA